ncbi:hypothetical protein [Magnetococcus sp. PR-3]|uniref:hypothetical protein n=1 Tax=Magnetococcus sp. PR-3 TaxID=3120355 RepID=UPI002FCE034F
MLHHKCKTLMVGAVLTCFALPVMAQTAYDTTYGVVYGSVDNSNQFTGTYDSYPSGFIHLKGNGQGYYAGYWAQSSSKYSCATQQAGRNQQMTSYWGRLEVQETAEGLLGKWSYCNAAPSEAWQAVPK